MDDWQEFKDSRFALWFKYPSLATNGEHVDRVETQQDGMLRVHILSPKSREVYFEVSKYDLLNAESEYQRHKENLPKQFHPLTITELKKRFVDLFPLTNIHLNGSNAHGQSFLSSEVMRPVAFFTTRGFP